MDFWTASKSLQILYLLTDELFGSKKKKGERRKVFLLFSTLGCPFLEPVFGGFE